ncbi:hypothetical protein TSTA_125700 [Talaromyces stipitatus ATCC 10500]|uniref:Uncharacterized protein n=1 Tax=Talaromyces stipitatus (strain ATCC 10500 / CBS 375.48 / QM 6759 / NRRL 1006) TaxID=441959 RepID=B8MB69_TALSN|nr:uncharacterized protein TSTA_125700 [Talaromyces stipitatus ATCC 10500]EED18858.1 hypothetical protein TSTA_125700 [Talaromyces stipitatus ATCC 10500]
MAEVRNIMGRGWLLNGTSSLLHLLYSSLEFGRTDTAMFNLTLDSSGIIEPDALHTTSSTMQVLLSPDNLTLHLYHSLQGQQNDLLVSASQLRDRIEQLFDVAKVTEKRSSKLRDMTRKILEGWDSKDLATFTDPVQPRFCKLGTMSKSWVGFTRVICAVALFGKGFGELRSQLAKEEHCELAQVILHTKMVRRCLRDVEPTKGEHGEVPSSSEDSDSDDFHDSGLGLSINSSSTNEEPTDTLAYKDYEIGTLCAVRALFDDEHRSMNPVEKYPIVYFLSPMSGYYVVVAGLPVNDYSDNSGTHVASHMIRTFPGIKFCLLHIQNGRFEMTSVITEIKSEPPMSISNEVRKDVEMIASRYEGYAHPGIETDSLFESHTVHKRGEVICVKCAGSPKERKDRPSLDPHVFYGLVASGNKVMKDARLRDCLAQQDYILCFEMEPAEVIKSTDCLIIRGICDYAHSHKNEEWQEYAFATAAAYANYFLSRCPGDTCRQRNFY